jgi:hypothetical protein
MGALLERMEQQAVILPGRSAGIPEDLLARLLDEQRTWKQINAAIAEGGDPTMLLGGVAGLEVTPSTKNETLVTGGATELALFPSTSCAFAKDVPGSPKLFRLMASGTSTTAATPGTYTLIPRIGNSNTGIAMGLVTGNITPVASATAAQWKLLGWCFVRSGSNAGIAQGSFEFNHSGTVGGGGPVSATGNAIFGGVSAAIDFTLTTNGLWMGVTHATSTTNTWTAQFVGWGSWNG